MTASWLVGDRYQVYARIGTGGMAEVYLARDDAGEWVALKQLLPHMRSDAMVVRMFVNEGRLTSRVHSPHVVQIREIGTGDTGPFIAMELLLGQTLAELRERAAEQGTWVPAPIALRVLADACRGLDAAHHATDDEGRPLSIVHRDFTPDNLHVSVDGSVRVIDFGIAKAANVNAGTEPGTLKGKFFYLSPEMVFGRDVDKRADVFAAGVMLYEQLCGRRPFTGMTSEEVLRSIANDLPVPPRTIVPSLPEALERVTLTALAKDPQQRYPTLRAFVDALEAAATPATRTELAAYLNAVFPPEQDERRQLIAQVRAEVEAGDGPHVIESAPMDEPGLAEEELAPVEQRAGGALKTVLAALVVVALLGGAGAWWWQSQIPAAERLARAQAVAEKSERISLLAPLARDSDATAEQLEEGGRQLLQAGAPEDAATLLLEALKRRPEDGELQLLLAEAAIAARNAQLAEEALTAAGKRLKRDPRPDALTGELRFLQGDRPGAIEALSSAQKKKDVRATRARLGIMLSQEQRLEEAEKVLSPLARRPVHAQGAAELGFVLHRLGQNADALTTLRRAITADPSLARAHYYLGAVLVERGEVREAEAAYRKADRLEPNEPLAISALCQVLVFQKKRSEVARVKAEMEERFPEESARLLAACE